MAEYRETIVERPVERSGGSGGVVAVFALVLVAIIAVAAYFMLANDNRETNAVTDAAQSVGSAADSVGDAAKDATGQQ